MELVKDIVDVAVGATLRVLHPLGEEIGNRQLARGVEDVPVQEIDHQDLIRAADEFESLHPDEAAAIRSILHEVEVGSFDVQAAYELFQKHTQPDGGTEDN